MGDRLTLLLLLVCTVASHAMLRHGRTLEFGEQDEPMEEYGPGRPPEGPASLQAMFDPVPQWLERLGNYRGGSLQLQERLQRVFVEGVVAWSDYSGLGGCEIAMSLIRQAVLGDEAAAADVPSTIFHRGSDVSATARKVLLAGGCESPNHVFGNILARVPRAVRRELTEFMRIKEDEFKQRTSNLEAPATPLKVAAEIGAEFMAHAHQIMRGVQFKQKVWCFKHRCECPVFPSCAGRLTVACAGTTCTSFSSMGKQYGWFAKSSIIFLAWAYEQLRARPTVIVHECVPSFDIAHLVTVFGALYLIRSLVICPSDLGVPVRRKRRWTILVLRSALRPLLAFDADGFGMLFFRRAILDGHALFSAPARIIADFCTLLAARKGLPPTQGDGQQWPIRMLLTSTQEARLREYEKACKSTRRSRTKYIYNIMQTPLFGRSWSTQIPTLLTKTSLIWSMKMDRCMVPIEHLLCQGIDALSPVCPFSVARLAQAGELSPRAIMLLAGNSFHMSVVTSVLMFIFSAFEARQQPLRKLDRSAAFCLLDFQSLSQSEAEGDCSDDDL